MTLPTRARVKSIRDEIHAQDGSCLVEHPSFRDTDFQVQKTGQLFLRVYNETLSVVAVRVSNEDCSPVRIHA
jgi:hypothetical protein